MKKGWLTILVHRGAPTWRRRRKAEADVTPNPLVKVVLEPWRVGLEVMRIVYETALRKGLIRSRFAQLMVGYQSDKVRLGHDADELTVLDNRQAADFVLHHDARCFRQRHVRRRYVEVR